MRHPSLSCVKALGCTWHGSPGIARNRLPSIAPNSLLDHRLRLRFSSMATNLAPLQHNADRMDAIVSTRGKLPMNADCGPLICAVFPKLPQKRRHRADPDMQSHDLDRLVGRAIPLAGPGIGDNERRYTEAPVPPERIRKAAAEQRSPARVRQAFRVDQRVRRGFKQSSGRAVSPASSSPAQSRMPMSCAEMLGCR